MVYDMIFLSSYYLYKMQLKLFPCGYCVILVSAYQPLTYIYEIPISFYYFQS